MALRFGILFSILKDWTCTSSFKEEVEHLTSARAKYHESMYVDLSGIMYDVPQITLFHS